MKGYNTAFCDFQCMNISMENQNLKEEVEELNQERTTLQVK